jgi:hypothetical protein
MKKIFTKRAFISVGVACLVFLVSISACSSPKPMEEEVEVKNEQSLENEIAQDNPNRVNPTEKEPLRFKDGPFAGEAIPADIRDSYTLADTAFFYQLPLDVLGGAFMIPPQYVDLIRHSDLKKVYKSLALNGKELGNSSVIMFVSLFKGMPFEPREPTYLLEMAVQTLKERGNLSEEQVKYLDQHTVMLSEIGQVDFSFVESAEDKDAGVSPIPPTNEEEDPFLMSVLKVDSQTTFQDVLDVGISMRIILEIIGAEKIGYLGQSIKIYCEVNGLDFNQVKDQLNQLLD